MLRFMYFFFGEMLVVRTFNVAQMNIVSAMYMELVVLNMNLMEEEYVLEVIRDLKFYELVFVDKGFFSIWKTCRDWLCGITFC